MGHGTFRRAEHRELAARLQRGPVAMVEPQDPAARRAWQEIIEILFSPEDAALAARLPVVPTGAGALARRFGIDEDDLRARLDSMADKGLVLDLDDARAGDARYMLAPPVVGFFEFSMMRLSDALPKARLARAYEAYVEGDDTFLREVADTETVVGRTLVHETQVEDLLPEVLDWERASACVEAAGRVSVTNCYCRHSAEHLGTRCEAPMETCMSLDGAADFLIRHGLAKPISPQAGLELLAEARKHGLVHIADNVRREITYVCSCCSCCCLELRSARRGLPVVQPSGFQAVRDPDLCTGCGDCVRACPVQAISLVARTARPQDAGTSKRVLSEIDLERCLGCGVCPAACRKGALTMERRPHPPYVPLNPVEYLTRRMLERGRLADLLVDGTAGRGPAFANAVLGVLLSLPPAERLLAREQLKSRFVAFALSRA